MRHFGVALAAAAFAGGALAGEVVLGDVRIQALSPTLVRVEPRGPMGFEDRTTFVVTGRTWAGIPIKQTGANTAATDHYTVTITQHTLPNGTCANSQAKDVLYPSRTLSYQDPATAADQAGCCDLCNKDIECAVYIWDEQHKQCYPLSGYVGTKQSSNRSMGCVRGCSGLDQITVTAPNGDVLYQAASPATSLLRWPGPLEEKSIAFTDSPRFFVPEWGPQPIPAGSKVDPALVNSNGYDFRNNVVGDHYIFLLGSTLDSWTASRSEFLQLAGGVPALPDYAWGTWFTWWHQYTEAEAKSDIARWEADKLPIDVWALDMNWRNTYNNTDRFYDNPNTGLLPDLAGNSTAWFDFLKSKNLYTYFNDHPYPVDQQASPTEVAFRWAGLTSWMDKGLTFWWFDHNWGFSIPPPHVEVGGNHTSGNWDGLSNAAWGSHMYHQTVERYNKVNRAADFPPAITLTKYALPDPRTTNYDSQDFGNTQYENPAHHRFPVWWTGDGVTLQISVWTMVDQGVWSFKPYVHSDCGGDYRPKEGGDLVRWVAHCSLGTILRLHGNDHRPWTYTPEVEDAVRSYLTMHYKLIPSLMAAGKDTTKTGFPLAARGDLFWPEHNESRTNEQYIHLKETLVAPIWDSSNNMTTRSVWVPPGDWQDGWTGEIVTGPKTMTVSKIYEQIPMWHKRGGFMVIDSNPGLRVNVSAWDELTLEAFPEKMAMSTTKSVFDGEAGGETTVSMESTVVQDLKSTVKFDISAGPRARSWVVRLHLRPGQTVSSAMIDGTSVAPTMLAPAAVTSSFPFAGAGAAPQPNAGSVAEYRVEAGQGARAFSATLQ